MDWRRLKAALLEQGSVRLAGEDADAYISRSAAGPSAGSAGSVFFAVGNRRVRLGIDPASPVTLVHDGGGVATLALGGERVWGRLEQAALHCPRQAYITVTGACIFGCRYCPVPSLAGRRKSVGEIARLVESVKGRIDAVSITSGVASTVEEEEEYVLEVVRALRQFDLPIGVAIYPTPDSPRRLHDLGVVEVKFNLETATPALFAEICPGLDRDAVWEALRQSVALFGRGRVFSNVIVGLGETDEEIGQCIDELAWIGVIPVIRPLSPAADLADLPRPSAERLLGIFDLHKQALQRAGLHPEEALTMCSACTACDLVPGRDSP
ncbi:radical SAM protein [Methanoculleus sp. FWC-SCC1]|uniref:Radical SAM protein n=1 Tax=Methanoculleus frigidifontis TaxID=2584085 RepID=A0ABT8MBM4_9EURY|nr:radical SAM protein [Methanoculleus sp. FWC-SCC1]MDN7025291.1 radical SAM protein [Methanoculleus sp. FWC-SCC1]